MGFVNLSELDIEVEAGSKPLWSVIIGDYRYVLYSAGKALVYKGDSREPSYEVSPVGCTCPGDRYSSNPCKHRKAISYIGDGSAAPPIEDTAVRVKEGPAYSVEDLLG